MSLRDIVRLSNSIPILLLGVLPLRAQTAAGHFAGPSSTGVVWPDTACQGRAGDEGPTENDGSATGCTSSLPLRREEAFPHTENNENEGASFLTSSEQQTSSSRAQGSIPEVNTDPPPSEKVHSSSAMLAPPLTRLDRNLDIYYRNRTEFSLDVGWHPKNIPFIYDFAVGNGYNMTGLKYTLVPIVASLRWHVTNVGWRWIFRGNMDFTFSGSITAIPRGPETHYYAFDFGIRRNFVYHNWKVVPYWEQRGGAGIIDAKEPLGVVWAQGQNLTFTYNMGAGVRYNIDSKYSFSAGMNYMHISNAYLSQPQFYNYGINVYGPMFGLNVRLGKPRHHEQE
jgi:hypothetical protein